MRFLSLFTIILMLGAFSLFPVAPFGNVSEAHAVTDSIVSVSADDEAKIEEDDEEEEEASGRSRRPRRSAGGYGR